MTVPAPRHPFDGDTGTAGGLLEILAARVVHYRLAMIDIARVIRPDHCMGCRITERILNNSDHS